MPATSPLAAAGANAPATGARVPDFFIVGQPKSGTTALHTMLRRHPGVFMPSGKEPWFLAEELRERTPPRPEGTAQNTQEYLALFAGAAEGQRIGEASALYLWSRTAAAAIAAISPRAQIIAILREPASLLRSLHLQFVETYVESEADFERALALEQPRREGREVPRHTYWPRALMYSEQVRYVEQLRRYHELFGRERVLVLIYDDFRADNEGTVRGVLRFLDLDDSLPIETVEANPTVQARNHRLHELLHAFSVGRGPVSRGLKATVKAVTPTNLRRGALRATKQRLLYAAPQPVDERFTRELRERYRGEVQELSDYLGIDLLGRWGYERVA